MTNIFCTMRLIIVSLCLPPINFMNTFFNRKTSPDITVDYTSKVVVLATNIRNFPIISRLYKSLPIIPTKIIAKFSEMIYKVIDLSNGTITNSNGHEIIAAWESLDEPPSYQQAVICSLIMIDRLSSLNSSLKSEDLSLVNIGIGLSTKKYFSEILMKKTTLYKTNLLLSEEIALLLNKDFIIIEIDRIMLDEFSIPIYTIIGPNTFISSHHQIISYNHHNKFLRAFREKRWDIASSMAHGLKNAWHNKLRDYYVHMIEQCKYLKDHPPSENWDDLYKIGK